MAHTARRLGDLEQARKFLQKQLEIALRSTSYPRLELAGTYALLAVIERDLGDANQARSHIQQSLQIAETLSSNDSSLAFIYSNLALAARDIVGPVEARDLFLRSIDLAHTHLRNQRDSNTAQVYSNLGLAARDTGDRQIAQQMLDRAISILEDNYDAEHYLLTLARYRRGLVEHDLGKVQEARSLIRQAYRVQLPKLGPDHPDTRSTGQWLAENDPEALREIITGELTTKSGFVQ